MLNFQPVLQPVRLFPLPKTLPGILFGSWEDKDEIPVAITSVERREDGKKIRVYVRKTVPYQDAWRKNANELSYKLYAKKEEIGSIDLDNKKLDELDNKKEHLYVDYMSAKRNDTYKGIGMLLHQLGVETSIRRGFDGRVSLRTMNDAVGFHYKAGFRAVEKKVNRQIRKAIKKAEALGTPKEVNTGWGDIMTLSKKAIKAWKKRIAKKPVLKTKA